MPCNSLLTITLALGLASLLGCGAASAPERVAVSGKVQFDGQPLATGTITFIPEGRGTAASGQITSGEFRIPENQGPSPGKCRVEILSFRETGRKALGPSGADLKQVIPTKYNTSTGLECVLVAKRSNSCEFELASK
jgi:hypothetical protein